MSGEVGALTREQEYFDAHKAEWVTQHRDEFVLLSNASFAGFYKNYEDAYRAGIQKFGFNSTFFVKQVCAAEPVFFIY